MQVLISGREIAVQESFRDPGQILHVLPYFIPENKREKESGEPYIDTDKRLSHDQRNDWWLKYSATTPYHYNRLPADLNRGNFTEITAQPLLNYLVALSYVKEKLTISNQTNLNTVYADLLDAVYERGYEDNRKHRAISDMEKKHFIRILEEIALAAWHGDGRTTTIKEIEDHCNSSGLRRLLEVFEEGAKAGVTRLLAAFYFRQSGMRSSEKTFEFTHKSFGEYLTACRIVRAMERIQKQLNRRKEDMEEGWDERQALLYWAEVCGPTRMDSYLLNFLRDEVALRSIEAVVKWQKSFSRLIEVMLCQGMPMEKIEPPLRFYDANQQAINSEESLLAALSTCALKTQQLSTVDWPTPEAFGTWIKRLQGQRTSADNVITLLSLNFLDLSGTILYHADLAGASLEWTSLEGTRLAGASLEEASLKGASLDQASLAGANLAGANLEGASLEGASLKGASLDQASLAGASLEEANLEGASLDRANLEGASLKGANLEGASLEEARLEEANLFGANFFRANLFGASLEEASLKGASLEWASLVGASLVGASLVGASLEKTNLKDISWNASTHWNDVRVLDKALNIPKKLRQQLMD